MMYNGMKGKHHSIKTRKKLSGKNNSMYGKSPSEKTREKLRIATIKWLESIGAREIGCKFYNKKACLYFSALSKEKGWNIKHAENGGEHIISGYSIDGYDENRNIVVEYDEPRHYDLHGNLKNNDVIRMSRIIKSSGCKFFRYNERTKTLTEHFSS